MDISVLGKRNMNDFQMSTRDFIESNIKTGRGFGKGLLHHKTTMRQRNQEIHHLSLSCFQRVNSELVKKLMSNRKRHSGKAVDCDMYIENDLRRNHLYCPHKSIHPWLPFGSGILIRLGCSSTLLERVMSLIAKFG